MLDALGLSLSEVISLYMRQIIAHRGLPFELRLPNAETRQAMQELDNGDGVQTSHEELDGFLKGNSPN